MKKLITAGLLLLSMATLAQTKTGTYGSVRTNHYKKYPYISSYNVVNKSGSMTVLSNSIKIDTAVYTIVRTDKLIDADEGMFVKPIAVVYSSKTGLKVTTGEILLSADKKVLAVYLRKSKSTELVYNFN